MTKGKVLFIFGTRPEAIKMAQLIKEYLKVQDTTDVKVCVTSQHREMLDQVLAFFNIAPDYDLDLMTNNQSIFDITANGLKALESVLADSMPDIVFVQGDTTTAFIGALAAFYNKVKIVHIEAGLRSKDKYSPFPEEINRVLVGHMADYHFAPTETAASNLRDEGITGNVWVVGNTGIDALLSGLDIIKAMDENTFLSFFNYVNFTKRIILVTGHRRESFGSPFENICDALKELAQNFQEVEIVYPVHLNPNVREPVKRILHDISNVHLIEPLEYPYLIWLMNKSYLVLTDSGGIQEEAPSLGKPVLVMREITERVEGIAAGTAKLIGTSKEKIIGEVSILLNDRGKYEEMSRAVNPYGDGNAAFKIKAVVDRLFEQQQ